MRDEQLLQQICPAFADVVNRHTLRIGSSSYDANAFGNAVIDANSERIRLRISRDRGDVSVDVGPAHDVSWYALEDVLAFIEERPISLRHRTRIEDLAAAFDKKYEAVEQMLSDRGRIRELDKRVSEKKAALIREFFGKSSQH